LRANFRPVVSEVVWQFIHGHPVDARRALVLADLFQGPLQVTAFENTGEQRGARNRLGSVCFTSDEFIPR
jgi:hypothetical protein